MRPSLWAPVREAELAEGVLVRPRHRGAFPVLLGGPVHLSDDHRKQRGATARPVVRVGRVPSAVLLLDAGELAVGVPAAGVAGGRSAMFYYWGSSQSKEQDERIEAKL